MDRPATKTTLRARAHRMGAGFLAVLVLASVVAHHPVSHRRAGASTVTGQVMFGAEAWPRNGETPVQAFTKLEASAGRKLALVRVYKHWDESLTNSVDTWARDGGRTLVLSVAPRRKDGTKILWRDIGAAPAGSALHNDVVRWAQSLKAYGAPVYFIFHHEPDLSGNTAYGTPADFVAAWRKVITTLRAQGVPGARYVWTTTAYGFERPDSDPLAAKHFYPGDDVVDEIGGDGYNFNGCSAKTPGSWRSFASVFEPMRRFGQAHPAKGLFAPEFGTVEDPAVPGRKGQWLADARATLKSPGWGQFKAVLYWHNEDLALDPSCTC